MKAYNVGTTEEIRAAVARVRAAKEQAELERRAYADPEMIAWTDEQTLTWMREYEAV